MSFSLHVHMIRGGRRIGEHVFDEQASRTIKIGRLASAQLRLEDPSSARLHAVIELSGRDAVLVDLGSPSGTLVNGEPAQRRPLQHGDAIVIGDTSLRIGLGSAPAETAEEKAKHASEGRREHKGTPQPAVAVRAHDQMGHATIGDFLSSDHGFVPQQNQDGTDPDAPPMEPITVETPITDTNRVAEVRMFCGDVLLRVHHLVERKSMLIGDGDNADYIVTSENFPTTADGKSIAVFPLLTCSDGEYVLHFSTAMTGEVAIGDQLKPLQHWIDAGTAKPDDTLSHTYALSMPMQAQAIVHWGGVTFAIRFVTPPPKIPRAALAEIDRPFLNSWCASLLLHTVALITFMVYPQNTEALKSELFQDNPDRFAKLILQERKETKTTQETLTRIRKAMEPPQEPDEELPPDTEQAGGLNTKDPSPNVGHRHAPKQRQKDIAQKFSGLFSTGAAGGGILGGGGGGTLHGSLTNVIGTMGASSASANLAGLGIRGRGPLTGGVGFSGAGTGVGTAGRLGSGQAGYGGGIGLGSGSGKGRSMIELSTPRIMGALSADVIKRVINENKNQIRYCYEFELQRTPDLEGRVLMSWIIDGNGYVSKAEVRESTLNNANVERCLSERIRTWRFPAPAGGGIVEVNYPFVFKSS